MLKVNAVTYSNQMIKNNSLKVNNKPVINQSKKATNNAYVDSIYLRNNITFKARIAEDIEHEQYIKMTEEERAECRKKYENFFRLIDINDLYMQRGRNQYSKLPLYFKVDMDDFINVATGYNKYKDNKIICVGRSPKWFLNASIWMKDGVEDYDFIAFSSNWYKRDNDGLGLNQWVKEDKIPSEEEKAAYKKYLKRKDCYPIDIVKAAQETGRPVIISDYIHSGCGLASFLDLLAQFADEEGILDEFARSIKLFTLSSMEYFEELGRYNYYSYPTVILPPILQPYQKVIEQEYHDMSADVMKQILIDKNTNECRSTYYPPNAWMAYNPDKFRTGLIPDEELLKMSKKMIKRCGNGFTDGMKDYRNLLNFRILDVLNKRDMLKLKHITR